MELRDTGTDTTIVNFLAFGKNLEEYAVKVLNVESYRYRPVSYRDCTSTGTRYGTVVLKKENNKIIENNNDR